MSRVAADGERFTRRRGGATDGIVSHIRRLSRRYGRVDAHGLAGYSIEMRHEQLPQFIRDNYEVHEWRHALAILRSDFSEEYGNIADVLTRFRLHKSWISVGGGRKSKVAEWIDGELLTHGWKAKNFDTKITVDERSLDSPTHEVDCFKNGVAPLGEQHA